MRVIYVARFEFRKGDEIDRRSAAVIGRRARAYLDQVGYRNARGDGGTRGARGHFAPKSERGITGSRCRYQFSRVSACTSFSAARDHAYGVRPGCGSSTGGFRPGEYFERVSASGLLVGHGV